MFARLTSPPRTHQELRRFCLDNGVTYQTFWTLTANPHILNSGEVQGVIKRLRGETGKVGG